MCAGKLEVVWVAWGSCSIRRCRVLACFVVSRCFWHNSRPKCSHCQLLAVLTSCIAAFWISGACLQLMSCAVRCETLDVQGYSAYETHVRKAVQCM